MKKTCFFILSILLLSTILTACSSKSKDSGSKQEKEVIEKKKVSDDFYTGINYDWLKENKIPEDEASVNVFSQLGKKVEKDLKKDLDTLVASEKKSDDPVTNEMINYYKKSLDFAEIDSLGSKPIEPYLAAIEKIESKDDYLKAIKDWNEQAGLQAMPISYSIGADLKDVSKKKIYVSFPNSILPEKSYYEKGNEQGEKILTEYKKAATELVKKMNISEKEAQKKIEHTLALDARIAKYELSAEEVQDATKMYNLMTREEVAAKNKTEIDIMGLIDDTFSREINEVVVSEGRTLENYHKIFDLDKIEEIKDWTYVSTLVANAGVLSNDYRQIVIDYQNKLSGTVSAKDEREKNAFNTVNNVFGEVVGKQYVKKHFSEEAKNKVETMAKNLIEAYKERLQKNNWLSEKTKVEAIKKLNTMVIKMGYSDKISEMYAAIKIDENKSFFENNLAIGKLASKEKIRKFDQPVDRAEWGIVPQEINAIYNPTNNDITFPAAILQAPFFSLDQTDGENYGGIGVVIGHEISHAFDTNGSHFDETGNMKDWWAKEDYQEFEKRAAAIVQTFDGLEFMGSKVNGRLTVSENIADLGGIRVSFDKGKLSENFDPKEFFGNYAKIWRDKTRPEIAKIKLATDTHSPNIWRVNGQVSNFDEFYEAYNITKKDDMWKDKKQRVSLW